MKAKWILVYLSGLISLMLTACNPDTESNNKAPVAACTLDSSKLDDCTL